MNLINKLKQQNLFSYNEQLIVDYLLAHPERSLKMSIYELATQTHSSTSTIVRLCKRCELSGFKEFKIVFARDLENYYQQVKNIDANNPFDQQDTDLMIANKIAKLTSETVMTTQRLLSDHKLKHATEMLLAAQNIYAIGVSGNFIRLRDFQLKLLRIGYCIRTFDLQAEQYYLALNSHPQDIALIVSYSGTTAEVVNDAKTFYQNHTPILAITGDEHSPLAKYATELLLLPTHERTTYKVSNFSSQLAVEYLLNVLYSCIFNRNFEKNYLSQKPTPISKFDF
ncbi:MurR/RpiR family transcriptional regulator [Lactiplantibacillus fabifermentans]|uniref:Transcriptional regulator n=2 Tax=Lactiplantibacillus fabifermentans TaxID=483011 RepID=A0A0R2NQV4_9LACO|nr:MurR/RpiR family transcriptional regulator [Lactiplantibacillus fabifermentans]ETY73116.1 RpiR family transcriptional regulator [Lactiplantibacillus fabifermentans T30PCM01]KRO25562.1 transcriptional regulator [Lactiplantibacillus fabifermentans DSM 21115]